MGMRWVLLSLVSVLVLASCKSAQSLGREGVAMAGGSLDPYIWLEEIESPRALAFVEAENKRTLEHFKAHPLFPVIEKDIRDIFLAKDRVPSVTLKKGELFNFWQDDHHVRGLWRKTSMRSYRSAKPEWEDILDVDALAKAENENWVWKGAMTLPPRHEKALVFLSRGGKDASVVREFDLKTKSFVKGGFELPEAKSRVAWNDENHIFVATDFGPGSLTKSGYPRFSKLWQRGTPLSSAALQISAGEEDMSVASWVSFTSEKNYVFHSIQHAFFEKELIYENEKGEKNTLPLPQTAEFEGVFKDYAFYRLRADLGPFKTASLVAFPLAKITSPDFLKHVELVSAPTDKKFVAGVVFTRNYVLLNVMDNVLEKIERVRFAGPLNWKTETLPLGREGMASVYDAEEESDQFLAYYTDFLTPASTYSANADDSKVRFKMLRQSPVRFNAKGLEVKRYEATSADGTKIPYFVVAKEKLRLDGSHPTLLYGYGGFEISMQPSYLSFIGKVWLEKGGVYVLSNLRGGGEFGPEWHSSVIKENRYKVIEDNIAIAEDLIKRGITSPEHLGISGRSNGGLLTGASFTARPDLFKAAIVGVPLLDMLRYHKLLAGASWMAEYGDPEDPAMRAAILKYSPYQKLSAQGKYPEVFVMTSTKDDRVHPGHARKMVARMKEFGHPVYYYENIEGGHAGSSNLDQAVQWNTLEYTYLWEKLQ